MSPYMQIRSQAFCPQRKTPQNINIYIWIPSSHPAVTWALRHQDYSAKITDPNKQDAKGKTDDRKGI